MDFVFSGSVYVTGNYTSAYQIFPKERWDECGTDQEALGKWLFEPMIADFKGKPGAFKQLGYNIVASGVDLGGGFKSIDQPVLTFKGAGVDLLIAESFNRIFFRNAINLGMPVLVCPGILEIIQTGDVLTADLGTGKVKNETTGREVTGVPMSQLALALEEAGGLLPYWKNKLAYHNAN